MTKKLVRKVAWGVVSVLSCLIVGGCLLLSVYKQEVYDAAIDLQMQAGQFTEKEVTIDGIRYAYLENNLKDKRPTLLMIHGFGAFKENWLRLAVELNDHFHMVLLDLPGHGKSSSEMDADYAINHQVERVHAFVSELGLGNLHLVGNSMGGAVSALYAAYYPQDVESAILLNAAGIRDVKSEYDNYLEQGQNPLIVETPEDFEFLITFSMAQPPFIPWFMADVSTGKMAGRKALNEKIWADITDRRADNFKSAIALIQSPTLIAWGDQDRVLDVGNAGIFNRLIPGSRLHIFEGVGHAPMIEIPSQCAELIKSFIAQR